MAMPGETETFGVLPHSHFVQHKSHMDHPTTETTRNFISIKVHLQRYEVFGLKKFYVICRTVGRTAVRIMSYDRTLKYLVGRYLEKNQGRPNGSPC